MRTVPDLAVEVVSPTDNLYDLDEKPDDYREAGIPMTWVINLESRVVRVHRPGHAIDELRDGDVLRGGPVLSGFAVNVTDILRPPSKPTETPDAEAAPSTAS